MNGELHLKINKLNNYMEELALRNENMHVIVCSLA